MFSDTDEINNIIWVEKNYASSKDELIKNIIKYMKYDAKYRKTINYINSFLEQELNLHIGDKPCDYENNYKNIQKLHSDKKRMEKEYEQINELINSLKIIINRYDPAMYNILRLDYEIYYNESKIDYVF